MHHTSLSDRAHPRAHYPTKHRNGPKLTIMDAAAGEMAPLHGHGHGRGRPQGQKRRLGRALLLALMGLGLVAAAAAFRLRLGTITAELAEERAHLAKLQKTVDSQQAVVSRFSSSVSNQDVLDRVQRLSEEMNRTEADLSGELAATQQRIEDLLAQTMDNLNSTVTQAQNEIEQEVNKVKHDVNAYVVQTQDQFSMENSFMIYQLAGTFTLLSSLISMWHMTAHLRRFSQPFVQRKILAILWMPIIYGLTSWLSLLFPAYEGYLAVLKDFYEAYVVYQFLSFLIGVLGRGDRGAVVDRLARHADHLKPPFRLCGCCLPSPYETPRDMARAVLLQCQSWTMQFVFFRPLTTIGTFACNRYSYYGPFGATGGTDYRSPQFWLTMVQNFSVFMAFSGLIKFYHAVQEDLAWCRPFPKFLTIKGIVFMTFWQGLAISILANTIESTPNVGKDDPELWARQAQNFLICLEMLLFSLAHFYCFPTDEWEEGYKPIVNEARFGDNMAMHDFFQDLKIVMRGDTDRKKKTQAKKQQERERRRRERNEKKEARMEEAREEIMKERAEPEPEPGGGGGEGGGGHRDGEDMGDVEKGLAAVAAMAAVAADGSFDEEDGSAFEGGADHAVALLEDNADSPHVPADVREASRRLLQAMAFESPRSEAGPVLAASVTGTHTGGQSQIEPHMSPTCALSGVGGESEGDDAVAADNEEPVETTGLLSVIAHSDLHFDSSTANDSVMGGNSADPSSGSGGDGVLRPSVFTTLGGLNNFS